MKDLNPHSHAQPASAPIAAERSRERGGESLPREDGARPDLGDDLEEQRSRLERQHLALQQAQLELQDSLHRYTDLYEHLPIGYVIVSPQGQIRCVNPAALDLLRQPRDAVVGRFFRRFLDAYDGGRFATHLETCIARREPATTELTLRPAAEDPVHVQLSSRVAAAVGEDQLQVHIAITDISKLKRTQRVLEEINREQEAFNHSISHDLRAPLVTISNYARIVLTDHAERLDDESRGMLQRIENAAIRMEETLKLLLEYSSLARDEVVFQPVELGELVRELLIEHRGVLQQRQARITVAPNLPRVRGSRVILGQVLGNLLTNALKYTRPGAAPQVEIGAENDGDRVRLFVRDHGIGIDPKHHERIFEIFQRLHGYSRYPGSGVGLAIARRAVERMNGRIWVESRPDEGSCFSVELPRA